MSSDTAHKAVLALAFGAAFCLGVFLSPCVEQAQASSYPTAIQYRAKKSHWKAKGSKTYLYATKKKASRKAKPAKVKGGLVKLGKKSYYFDAKGAQRTGWTRVAPSYYAFFERENGKGGVLAKSKTVEGIRLDSHGYAKLNKTNLPELELYVKANDLLRTIAKPRWSKERTFKACFDYFASYEHFSYYSERTFRDYTAQHVDYALDLLDPDKRKGDCDSWSTAFAYVVTAMGSRDVLVVTNGTHSWVEIGGLIYDPQRSIKHSRTYGIRYGELPGKDPYKKYTRPHVAYRVYPAQRAWTGAAVAHAKLKKAYRLVKFSGARYYAAKAGYAVSKWATWKHERYYLKSDGTAAAGSYRAKEAGKKRWLVFRANGKLARGNGSMYIRVAGKLYYVTAKGRAISGVHDGKFYLPTGEAGTGVRYSGGAFYALGSDGTIDKTLSKRMNDAAVQGADASGLLSLLGEYEKVTETSSCLDYLGYQGTDRVYQYENFKLQTFSCDELGEVYWCAYSS